MLPDDGMRALVRFGPIQGAASLPARDRTTLFVECNQYA
jgi:hypothetical protein